MLALGKDWGKFRSSRLLIKSKEVQQKLRNFWDFFCYYITVVLFHKIKVFYFTYYLCVMCKCFKYYVVGQLCIINKIVWNVLRFSIPLITLTSSIWYTNNIKKNGEVIDQKKWRGQRPLARSMEKSKDAEYIFIN